jgi:AMP-binding enzyme
MALVAIAASASLAASWERWINPFVDSGREMNLPERLADGEKLYRDVIFYYGPAGPWLQSLALRACAPAGHLCHSWLPLELACLALTAAILVLLYRLTAAAGGTPSALAAAALSAAFCLGAPHGGAFIFPYSASSLYALAGSLLALVASSRPPSWRRRALVAGGIALALTARIEIGAPTAVILLVAALRFRQRSTRDGAAVAPGASAGPDAPGAAAHQDEPAPADSPVALPAWPGPAAALADTGTTLRAVGDVALGVLAGIAIYAAAFAGTPWQMLVAQGPFTHLLAMPPEWRGFYRGVSGLARPGRSLAELAWSLGLDVALLAACAFSWAPATPRAARRVGSPLGETDRRRSRVDRRHSPEGSTLRPLPGTIETTVRNLREVPSTLHFNVPRGYDMLIPFLRQDAALRESFFRELDAIFNAAAALPPHLWTELRRLSVEATGRRVFMLAAWGSTETSPLATHVHFPVQQAAVIGLPAPGIEIKLAPVGGKLELRVRGPNVTPGYWRQPELAAERLDEDGFLRMGDAGRLADPEDPSRGILFDGRLAENFKLMSGTWVHVGELRLDLLSAAAPLAQEVVVTGHDRREIGLLVFPDPAACRELCGEAATDAPLAELIRRPEVRGGLAAGLAAHNAANPASSRRIVRALLVAEPPSIQAGEITDKGHVNQRAVLTRRAGLVERLYGEVDDRSSDLILL